MGLEISLVGIHGEEECITFARIERKTPVLRPALQPKQTSSCGLHRSGNRGCGGPNGQIVSVKTAADGRRQRGQKIIDEEREKYRAKNGSLRNTSTDSKKNDSCDFEKPHRRASQKEKIESNEQSKEEGQPKSVCGKGQGCQTESKALEKSIVERIVREPGLGLLNPSEMD